MCKTIGEIKQAIREYRTTLTPEKCANFISRLKKVYLKENQCKILKFVVIVVNL
jgi:hypothetical protein